MNESIVSFFSHSLQDWLKEPRFSRRRPSVIEKVYREIYRKFNLTTVHIAEFKKILGHGIDFSLPHVIQVNESRDGTKKFILGFQDGNKVESVLIPFKGRYSICVSSQVGCQFKCQFCYTGTMGLKRNLGGHEIIGQVLAIIDHLSLKREQISNIVFMGQGEPLSNSKNVKKALSIFLDQKGLEFWPRRLTVSTAGLVPQLKKWDEFFGVNLSLSLYSPIDSVPSQLMPINIQYSLKELIQTCERISLKGRKKISLEYTLFKGLNDRDTDVEKLSELLDPKKFSFNFIPYNPFPGDPLNSTPTPLEEIYAFKRKVQGLGLSATVRKTKGQDILAACGQLFSP